MRSVAQTQTVFSQRLRLGCVKATPRFGTRAMRALIPWNIERASCLCIAMSTYYDSICRITKIPYKWVTLALHAPLASSCLQQAESHCFIEKLLHKICSSPPGTQATAFEHAIGAKTLRQPALLAPPQSEATTQNFSRTAGWDLSLHAVAARHI